MRAILAASGPLDAIVQETDRLHRLHANPPNGWKPAGLADDGAQWISRAVPSGTLETTVASGLAVMASVDVELDGRTWLHVSCSRASQLPSYRELQVVHRVFIGSDRVSMQLFVPVQKHVNIHPFCLHLWSCVDGYPIPDFTRGGMSI